MIPKINIMAAHLPRCKPGFGAEQGIANNGRGPRSNSPIRKDLPAKFCRGKPWENSMNKQAVSAEVREQIRDIAEEESAWVFSSLHVEKAGAGYMAVVLDENDYSRSYFEDAGVSAAELDAAGIGEHDYGHPITLFAFDKNLKVTDQQSFLDDRKFGELEAKIAAFKKGLEPAPAKKSVDKER